MGKLTRKQKKNLRDVITGVSGCAVIALILVVTSLINQQEHIPVVFSDILDGAKVTAGTENEEIPEISLEEDYLYETLFETESVILTTTPEATTTTTINDIAQGAGGTLLLNTTEKTEPPEITTTTRETTTPVISETTKITTTTAQITREDTTTKKSAATIKTTTTTKAPVSGTKKTPFTNIGGGIVSDDEIVYITMLNLVNEEREKHGLEKLWYSARVHEIATLRAYELTSYYSHTRSDGRGFHTAFVDNGIKYKIVGENIAYGRNMFDTVEEVFNAWMDSESHRDNILSPEFECAGFGLAVLEVGKDTYYYWSQEFATFS